MKIFISQPMNGLCEAEIRDQREHAVYAIQGSTDDDVEIEILGTEPRTFDTPPTNAEKISMLADSLKILANADRLVLIKPKGPLPNGCAIECQVAKRYGIPIDVYRPERGSGWEVFG
jgi:hypothetical protein